MTTPHNDSRLTKIRALLAMAEDPAATPPEAEAFTAKAAELISAWGLEDAIRESRAEERPSIGDKIIRMDGSYQKEKAILLEFVADGLGGSAVQLTASKPLQVHVFGTLADIARYELLFTSLLVQASQGLASIEFNPWATASAIRTYRRGWLHGYAHAIYRRLNATREQDISNSGVGTDLVLADRSKLVEARQAVFYPTVKTIKRRLSGPGQDAGRWAGERANLSTGEGQVGNGAGARGLAL